MLTASPAAGEARQCVVKGAGADRRAAILDGLLQAIQQVNGVSISQKSVTQRRYADLLDDVKESFSASVVDSDQIQTASRGLIQSYEILQEIQSPQTHAVEVRLKAMILIYDPQSPLLAGQRKVIAVLPFRVSQDSYRMFDADIPAKNLLGVLSQDLVQDLVQSRKFTVLDRDFLGDLMGEQKLIQAGKMPQEEQLRIGQQLGADFLLVGSLDDLGAGATVRIDHLTGQQITVPYAKASISYRILNVATGKVHWADTYHHTYGAEELNNVASNRAGFRPEEYLLQDAGAVISDQVITGVFPIRVLAVNGADMILNQGGERAPAGAEFDVYNQGDVLIDPDTNEPLERVETLVASIRVVRVTNKVAYATAIAGDASKIKPEAAICRRHTDLSAKYLHRSDSNGGGLVTAVLVVSGQQTTDSDMSQKLAEMLRGAGVKADDDFFTAALVGDGIFSRIFQGSARDIDKLELSHRCNYLVLAQKTDTLIAHRELQGMITGDGSLDIRVIRTSDGECVDQFTVTADASGFTQGKAEDRLDQNLSQKITRHGFGAWLSEAQLIASHATK